MPVVAYENGQLTVVADNATLGSILQVVRDKTSALLELPAGADERVFGRWGPGPVREVLAALLNGSNFNYVMLGSATNPDGLAQIILFTKPPDPVANKTPLPTAASIPEPVEAEAPPHYAQQESDRIAAEEHLREQRSVQLLQALQRRQAGQPRD